MASQAKRLELRATLSGPFFAADPSKTTRRNIRDMMDALAEEAEKDVRAQITSAHVNPNVKGYTTGTKTNKRWATSMAVNLMPTGNKAESIQNAAILYGRRKGNHGTTVGIEAKSHPFARTTRAIRGSRAVLAANLTKGIE
ncbi:hypothetical protein UFOVP1028_34 [uncultured Caudovirales phage]|uniref:Uncharacterized protein n=1 Tax=uncultured Caudovirales phage TaxID=2100421 RepID=A0A6J5QC34_9CAUD|nr:hypothetical protein UFOVP960_45 [uncultured Caudovirales phage]CAB4179081.1 hypothetical protein UFOVP1028_34 [uncultured Caudovirales phage]CAB4189448.1 hypothetical protein UFOVP1187_31 [uncultured Caudovirales phage]CAB4192088.1 hypothetical protein UFOVP1235_2 [uncultured Caudovirales phage]CAB4215892.1 hypothetical protein UFOVP1488_31 [uncultured Caudovirales phage]